MIVFMRDSNSVLIGENSSVSMKVVITPGSSLPPNTCLGPLSSSYELEDARPEYRHYCRTTFRSPPILLIVLLG